MFRLYFRLLFTLLAVLLAGIAMPAYAQATPWSKAEFSQARLHVGGVSDAKLATALEVQLNDGWKTYWRSAGDAGFPLSVELLPGSSNVQNVTIGWPQPKRFIEEWGLEVFGYKKHVTFPLTFSLKNPSEPSLAILRATYAVCSDICLSEEHVMRLEVPAGGSTENASVAAVKAAQDDVPEENGAQGLTIHQPEIRKEDGKTGLLAVRVESENGTLVNDADLFVEGPVGLRFPKPKLQKGSTPEEKTFLVPYEISAPAKSLKNAKLTTTLVNNDMAIETMFDGIAFADPDAVTPESNEQELPEDADDSMMITMILLALLGGLILNVMPCVLPVLSLKLLSVAKHGGGDQREVRRSFVMSVLGILSFFVGLAILTIVTKHAGQAVGWGLHFQSTPFLTFLSGLIFLVAANLLGIFEITLPECLNTRIYETGRGGKEQRHHLLGDFATGIFAALMATPCSAPFLGTAVGFALARGDAEIMVIFVALGVGLALPYLLAAFFPAVATKLPKPGMWMVRVKQVMGALMLVAALWLISVLVDQAGSGLAAFVLIVSVAIGVVLHGRDRWLALRRRGRVPLILLGLFAVLYLASTIPPGEQSLAAQRTRVAGQINWQPFKESEIPDLVADGKIVFVDVTAEWCLTCKANKLFSLSDADVVSALTAKGVVAMQGDLTKPDKTIEKFLRKHKRYGIPFNIVYGPAHPEGMVLPELLTPAIALDAIKSAKK